MPSEYSNSIILKILNGIQAGVDVALFDGDYVVGSGDDVDIQIYDVMLSPHHTRLSVRQGKVSIVPLSGEVQLRSGFTLEPGDAERQLYPLDRVTIGTTHFAVAPASADWASIDQFDTPTTTTKPTFFDQSLSLKKLWREQRATFIAAVAGLLLLGFWIFPYAMLLLTTGSGGSASRDEQLIVEAVSGFDFAERLQVTKAQDGTIQVRGLLDRAEDRAAAIAAINGTGVLARTHIMTIDVLRDNIATLIDENAPGITFTLSPQGGVTLQGVLADESQAQGLVQLVQESVGNTALVRSEIVTQTGLLQAVAELATKAHVAPFVSFQLADDVIEAEGALGIDMLDAWAGFLQAYSSRFADAVSLRSYVQQRNPDGTALPVVPGMALYLGKAEPDGRTINMQRLRDGTYTAADLLIGGDAAATAGRINDVSEAQERLPPAPSFSPVKTTRRRVDLAKLLNRSAEGTSLAELTIKAIQLWEADKLKELEDGAVLHKAIDKLAEPAIFPTASPEQYKTVLAQRRRAPSRACWAGSRLSMENAVGAVFWLDLFSRSDMMTLADFDSAYGQLLVEAALNPLQTAKCVGLASDGSLHSHYLETVSNEPHNIGAVLSALPAYPAQITGISLPATRYFQLYDGRILREGEQFDANTSVLSIGEMGVLFASGSGLAVTVTNFGGLAWKTN